MPRITLQEYHHNTVTVAITLFIDFLLRLRLIIFAAFF